MARSGRQPRRQSPRKDSHFRNFGGCLCLIRVVSWRMRVRIYILVEFTCVCVYIKYIHTKSSCVWIDVVRGVHMCLDIYLFIYTQGLHVYIYVYAHRVHMCGYMFTYMHPRFICVCVYITYIHAEFTCACEYDCECTHKIHIYMCTFWRVFTRSSHVCVHASVYARRVAHRIYMCMCIWLRIYTESLRVGVQKYPYIHPVFTCMCIFICVYGDRVQTYVWVCMYLCVDTRSLGVGMCVHIYLRTLYGCVYTFVCLWLYIYTHLTNP